MDKGKDMYIELFEEWESNRICAREVPPGYYTGGDDVVIMSREEFNLIDTAAKLYDTTQKYLRVKYFFQTNSIPHNGEE